MSQKRVGKSLAGVVAAVLMLAGCGGDSEQPSLAGTWNWSTLTVLGVTATADDVSIGGSTTVSPAWIQQFSGQAVSLTIKLNADETMTMTATATVAGQVPQSISRTGSWSVDGDTITMELEGEEMTADYSVSGSTLTLESDLDNLQALVSDLLTQGSVPSNYIQFLERFASLITVQVRFTK